MQINIDKKTGTFLVIILALVAIIFGMSINNDREFIGMHRSSTDSMPMDRDEATSKSGYSGADVMFLQMMIPHHQQAIDISNLALKRTKDSELNALARNIIRAQSAEIIQMKAWLNAAGASTEISHSMGHGMGGMLDDAELAELNKYSGTAFDLLWLKGMIAHHEGAIHMTGMITDADKPEIKSFGEKIIKDQSAQIDQMKAMQKRLNS